MCLFLLYIVKTKKAPKLIGVSFYDHVTEMQMIGVRESDSFDQRGSFDQRKSFDQRNTHKQAQSFDDDIDDSIPF